MKHLLGALLLTLTLIACGDRTKKEASKVEKQSEFAEVNTITKDSLKFPVYDFSEFEHLLSLEDGKTYVINFWATWCKPCLEEMPYFEQVYAEQKKNGLEVILVSLDMPSMWKSRLEPYVEKKELKSKVVILDDPKQNEWIPKIDPDWDGAIPATVIYNTNDRKFYGHGFTYDELNEAVNGFLNMN